MRATENPLLYVLAHPEARRLLSHLEAISCAPYEQTRKDFDLDPETFHRVTRLLSRFDLVHLRPAKKGEFENGRIRLAIALSPRAPTFLKGLRRLDAALVHNRTLLGEHVVGPLAGAE